MKILIACSSDVLSLVCLFSHIHAFHLPSVKCVDFHLSICLYAHCTADVHVQLSTWAQTLPSKLVLRDYFCLEREGWCQKSQDYLSGLQNFQVYKHNGFSEHQLCTPNVATHSCLDKGRGQGKFPFHAGGTDINDTRASPLLSGLHSMNLYGGLLSSWLVLQLDDVAFMKIVLSIWLMTI